MYALLDDHNQKVYYTKADYCNRKDLDVCKIFPPGKAEAQTILDLAAAAAAAGSYLSFPSEAWCFLLSSLLTPYSPVFWSSLSGSTETL